MLLKYGRYLLIDINTKYICNPSEKKNYFAPLRILYLFVKSFVNFSVDISLAFSDRSFSFFQTLYALFYLK